MPLIAFVGCQSTRVQSTYLGGDRFESRPTSHPIEILRGDPTRPFVTVARITAVARGNSYLGTVGDEEECIGKLKERARQLGGDAVIQFEVYMAPQGTVGAGNITAQGFVVRWVERS